VCVKLKPAERPNPADGFGLARLVVVSILLAVCLALPSCTGGRPLKFDTERIAKKCSVDGTDEISQDQALCIAKLAGLKPSRNCPLDLREADLGDDEVPVFVVHQICSGTGVSIDRASGKIVAVELGEGQASSIPDAANGG